MKYCKILLAAALGTMFVATSCQSAKKVDATYSYVQFESTCVGVEGDGTQTVRAWGRGSSRSDAVEQAKKNAVYDVIFRGIKGGMGCEQRPLVFEVNARERYANYFDPFFADGGEYLKFVKEDTPKEKSRYKASANQQNYGIIVTVDRPALRRQLVADGILAQ